MGYAPEEGINSAEFLVRGWAGRHQLVESFLMKLILIPNQSEEPFWLRGGLSDFEIIGGLCSFK